MSHHFQRLKIIFTFVPLIQFSLTIPARKEPVV